MGCGESKHADAVATTEPVSSSKRWRSLSRKNSKNSETKNEINDAIKYESVGNDSSSESKTGQEKQAEKETKEVEKELSSPDLQSEKISLSEAKSGDLSPLNALSIEKPISKEEISGGSGSTQNEKGETTDNGAENENADTKEEEATPRAEKEENILIAMDEAAGSAEN